VTTREKTTNGLEDKIESSDGPLMYKVKTDLGSTWRRHVDQIKPSKIAKVMTQNTPLIEEPSVETTENTPLMEEPSVETTENTPLIEEPSVETTENTPLIEEPSVETRETIPPRGSVNRRRLITEILTMLGSDYTVLRHI
jgi:hypothetical protein